MQVNSAPWQDRTKPIEVICPYCQAPAELVGGAEVYPHRPDLYWKKFWLCRPCKAHVGCHENSAKHAPLGRLANAELRTAKIAAHAAFDPWWQKRGMSRSHAYRKLGDEMGIPKREVHIGMFDLERCRLVVEIVQHWTEGEA